VGLLAAVLALSGFVAAPAGAVSSTVVISEVLTRGPGGSSDEFVELYNRSGRPVDISGWRLDARSATAASATVRATVPASSTLGAGCHYLIAGTNYPGSPVAPDLALAVPISDAVGIALRDSSSTTVDAVAMYFDATTEMDETGPGFSGLVEGTPVQNPHDDTVSTDAGSGLERRPGGILGEGQDTDDNAADFQVVTPTDPQSTASPCVSPLTATGAAARATAQQDGSALLTVALTPGTPSPSNGFAVTADLSAIGGSPSQPLFDDGTHGDLTAGDHTFSFTAAVSSSASIGPVALPATATDAQGRQASASIQLTLVAQPESTAPPTISGSATPGQMLTEVDGSWPGTPVGFDHQWQDCDGSGANCAAIAGAVGQTYVLTAADLGHTVRVQETALYTDGPGVPASSAPTELVQAPASVAPPPPTELVQAPASVAPPPPNSAPPVTSVTPVVTPGPRSAQVKAALSTVLKPSGKAAKLNAIVKAGGFRFSFSAPSAGKLVIDWSTTVRGKQVLVASTSAVLGHAGRATVKVKLTRKGATLLKAGRSLKIHLKATFTPTGRTPITSTGTTTVRP
jgi:Lamin Tail Domain